MAVNQGKIPLPLDGIRLLDATHIVAGPFCSMLLGDAGAEVIKIERPGSGDRSRQNRPYIVNERGEKVSSRYLGLNRNKKSITLDLRYPRGRVIFEELVKISDIVLDNWGPGAMKRLGFSYDRLSSINPSIIYASITGYGNRDELAGPYSDWAANNPCSQAMGGWMEITGDPDGPPQMVGDNIGDSIPALWTAYGILLALEARRRTGLGQHVDVAMYDCMIMHNTASLPHYMATGEISTRQRENMLSAQLTLRAKDGYVVLAGAIGEEKWVKLWEKVGKKELAKDPRYLGRDVSGPFFMNVIRPTLEEWTKSIPKVELTHILLELGFSAAMVQNVKDILDCPHLKAREMFVEFDDPIAGRFITTSSPVKLSKAPGLPVVRPPFLGEHNQEVLCGLLGLEEGELESLRKEGVI